MGVSTVLSVGFWIFKQWFNWMGASKEQMEWLAKTTDELHTRGWARKSYVVDLDEKQNSRLRKKLKEEMENESDTE